MPPLPATLTPEQRQIMEDGVRTTSMAILTSEGRAAVAEAAGEEHVRIVDEAVLLTSEIIQAIARGDASADPSAIVEWGDSIEKSVALIKVGAAIAHQAIVELDGWQLLMIPALCLTEVQTLHEYYGKEFACNPIECAEAIYHGWNMCVLDPEHDPQTCGAGPKCDDFVCTMNMIQYMMSEGISYRPGMVFFAVIRIAAALWRAVAITTQEEEEEAT